MKLNVFFLEPSHSTSCPWRVRCLFFFCEKSLKSVGESVFKECFMFKPTEVMICDWSRWGGRYGYITRMYFLFHPAERYRSSAGFSICMAYLETNLLSCRIRETLRLQASCNRNLCVFSGIPLFSLTVRSCVSVSLVPVNQRRLKCERRL